MQQRDAKLLLQHPDLTRQGRLGDPRQRRGLREALGLDDLQEAAELAEIHAIRFFYIRY
jgi:hypothetical protein